MKSYAYIGAMPNPVGVGQETLLHIGITQQLSLVSMGWDGLSVTIEKPDGTTETISNIRTDSTGGTGRVFIPTMVGNYTIQTHFPEQTITATKTSPGIPIGTVMQASDSEKLTLVVQENAVPQYPATALPTEYWTRPIDGQYREWSAIAGNWLGWENRYDATYVPGNDGPETGHILWSKELKSGGVTGEPVGEHAYEDGDAYEGYFANSVILGGKLYYNRYNANGGNRIDQEVVAVDLHTGEELWVRNWNNSRLAFGQVFYWESFNYMGVFDYLWTTSGSTWTAFNPTTGRWEYTVTDVPSGTRVDGPKGEIYIYTLNTANGWMTRWNSSRAGNPQLAGNSNDGSWGSQVTGRIINGTRGYDFNVTIPKGLPGSAQAFALDDKVVGVSVTNQEVITWALSLKEEQEGTLLYNKTWNAPPSWTDSNTTLSFRRISLEDGVFVVWMKETRQWWGFSTETGQLIWGPTEPEPYLNIYASSRDAIVLGKLLTVGYSGTVYAYDVKTGKIVWTFTAEDPYNEILWSSAWPLYMGFVTDGKLYLHTTEHSGNNPKPRGNQFYCLDLETGEEIFEVNLRGSHWGNSPVIGDSIIAMLNTFDMQIYALGKGPSAITVTAPNTGVALGSSVLISGTVTDISPGTTEYARTARFPNGVPAVSDQNMSQWMEYVYLQSERPTDIIGVPVTLSVIDANGNYRTIGNTTSDADGFFSYAWQPDIEGKYTVIATFDGSKAFYGSHAEAAFVVDPSPVTPTPQPTQSPSIADLYFLPMSIAIIIVILVVGAVIVLSLRKRP
ncbi:MAG: PQQ-binding-like beta-propeller repeat protein [Methanocella sp.]